ncbi:MAG: excinuclease ABC subunit UvrC [Actinobacteria bacterium]|nr:excinuclease ABC subunit UvrC [Actinomycetota bacterium]
MAGYHQPHRPLRRSRIRRARHRRDHRLVQQAPLIRVEARGRDNGPVTPPRPETGSIPDGPGSYQFKDKDGRVIYVGKAASLRSRVGSYFQAPAGLPPRTAQMVAAAQSVEWIQVANNVEALMLEYSLIKKHRPRFNIRLRDDKSYPWLAVTTPADEWPRAMVLRGRKRKGVVYFGPYAHAYAIRETLDLLLRTFPIRTCSDTKLARHQRQGRPCLLFHIEKCTAPCVGNIDQQVYGELVNDLLRFLDGETQPVIDRLEASMNAAADELDYERAARIRDRLATVRKAVERQQMVTEKPEDFDLIGLAEDNLEAAVQVFHVRRGRVVGRNGFILDKVEDLSRPQLVGHVLEQLYAEAAIAKGRARRSVDDGGAVWVESTADALWGGAQEEGGTDVPRQILVPDEPDDCSVYEELLSQARGGPVTIRIPQRGSKRALAETVTRNAADAFQRHRLRRSSDHNSRARALTALQDELGLPDAPLRIECFDMSHIQGRDYVGSMVVMEDGLPKKSDYRRFKVRTVEGNDDYAAMEEVIRRRLGALKAERDRAARPESEEEGSPRRPAKFSYPPQLLLVDGGKGQLGVATRVVEEMGLADEIPVAALAKQFEEVFVPGSADPVRIPRQSEALYLLQRVRDEAHRFAVDYHRNVRGKRMTTSVLDDVPGLGPTRRKRLIKEFGGIKAIKEAPLERLEGLKWLPSAVAKALYDKLHTPS